MVKKKTWNEFRACGLLWFVNTILHTFGWAITFEFDKDGCLSEVYPARVSFRGFSEDVNSYNYIKISEYMKNNADILLKEAKDEDEYN